MDANTARTILRQADGYIDWDHTHHRPNWYKEHIILEGRFTLNQLQALIALHPGAPKKFYDPLR